MSSVDVARLIFGYLSDQGLEKTKNAFSKESPDLVGSDFENHMNEGQKLSSIIKEYFKLKGNEKKEKPTDSESLLLSLWKQFDVLVGQLKHTTIHNSKDGGIKLKVKGEFSGVQKARVRKLNKQNWVALQQKNKSLAANRDPVTKPIPINALTHGPINDLNHRPFDGLTYGTSPNLLQCPPQPSINSQFILIGPHPAGNVIPGHSPTVSRAPLWKTATKNVTPDSSTRVLPSNVIISENIQEVNSSQHFQSEQSLPSDHFKSPKRKSVPPKKRTSETVPAVPPAQICTKTVTSTQTSVQEDGQLDIQNIVDTILGRPELSEKLAENINRAVEIDALPSQQSDFNKETENNIQTQNAVVNSNKVDDIMEMMKSDPVFEELFSSFENFESCEESDTKQIKDSERKNSSNQSSTSLDGDERGDECANEALDALLLLASSPVRSMPWTSGNLETPQKCKSSVMFSSPTSSTPVILSPGGLKHTKRPSQPIMSHVRQLNFVGTDKTVGNGSTSQGTYSEDNTPASTIIGIKPLKNGNTKMKNEIEIKDLSTEGILRNDLDKKKGITEVNVEKTSGIGLEKGMGNDPDILHQSGQKESNDRSKAGNDTNVACCSDETDMRETTDINVSDTDRHFEKENTTSFKGSPLKLCILEDLATNELLQCKTIKPVEKSPLKITHRVTKGFSVKNVDEEECNRTILCEPTEAKDISTDSDNTSMEIPEELTSTTAERLVPNTNIKTQSNKTSGNDLSSSTESDKTSKRKLKKKKKSTRTSKKAKIIPEGLDVDRFLSSLHYVHEEKM